ncbi:FAD:protein FMN transferase [Spirochaetia bacterium 38H-sp]|uniref:FAD:protein FMN transferase n=1 Tax=Rarispira pelagica TaxID=3141764 RepID=A0ABU9U8Y1_9SPIR
MKRVVFLLLLLVLFFSSCRVIEPVGKTEFVLGTVCTISVYDNTKKASQAIDEVFAALKELEKKLSANDESSMISRINKYAYSRDVSADEETAFILKKAMEYAEKSGGAFDPAIGAIVKLWNIGTEDARVPSENEIEKLLLSADYQNINIRETSIRLLNPDTRIDLGAIAKGYASDIARDILKKNGITRAIIDLGGNIYAMGKRPTGEEWRIGIQDPRGDKGIYIGIVHVSDMAVVTSGDYERFFTVNGKRYHHIIDPTSGYPAENGLLSVSVISKSGIDADALSTTLFVLGADKGKDFIKKYAKDAEAVFITTDRRIITTDGLKDILDITTTNYQLGK